jgi:hypothetical protein
MKGTVFVIFEKFVIQSWGEEAFEDLMDLCPHVSLEPFISPETYPDEWMTDMLLAACGKLEITPETALRSFGKFAFSEFYRYAPAASKEITHPLPFLLSVHDVIHVEVRTMMDEASPPNFTYERPAPDQLVMHYHSKRQLCHLMEGLLDGVSEHFQVPIQYEQTACKHRSDQTCVFLLKFGTAP